MAVLDTDFLIALERGSTTAFELHDRLRHSLAQLRVPTAVWCEYLCMFPPLKREEVANLLLASVHLEPFDRVLADRAAQLQHNLLSRGERLGWHDLQVAATALHHGEPLVSRDTSYRTVPGLEVFDWQ